MHNKQCTQCDKEFTTNKKNIKYCSEKCRKDVRRRNCRKYKKQNKDKIKEYNKKYKAEKGPKLKTVAISAFFILIILF